MSPGTTEHPLRVAIVGAGPAGFYVLRHLFNSSLSVAGHGGSPAIRVDMFDRLPTPFGLVRQGVAPDHPKIKSVTRVYQKLARDTRYRFFGDVEFGKDVDFDDLRARYHQIVLATGAPGDRRLNIPGEDLAGSHSAAEFVAWYNGHPDYSGKQFDLSRPSAVVVGVGNVAVDVARILCLSPEELTPTDVADYALDTLRGSGVRDVHLLGRRGPAQAAFTSHELSELGDLAEAETVALLDPGETEHLCMNLDQPQDPVTTRKIEILRRYARAPDPAKPKKLIIRFLVSPVEILGDENGDVRGVRLEKNECYTGESGATHFRPTGRYETIEAGLVLRAVGYRGVRLPGLPFDADVGVIPSRQGRVVDSATGEPLPGVYVSGWIKRGPTGLIGTNNGDAKETVERMLEDLSKGVLIDPSQSHPDDITKLLEDRGARFITFDDWEELDTLERVRGMPVNRPRVKFTQWDEFLKVLEALEPPP